MFVCWFDCALFGVLLCFVVFVATHVHALIGACACFFCYGLLISCLL